MIWDDLGFLRDPFLSLGLSYFITGHKQILRHLKNPKETISLILGYESQQFQKRFVRILEGFDGIFWDSLRLFLFYI